jgi:predicted AAA+ superfamily ATPase
LLCHLLNRDSADAFLDGPLFGTVLENFVIMELLKQISWSKTLPRIYHFRTERGDEVDIVLETGDGRIIGIECKGGVRIGASAFRGLKALRELTGKNFHRGIVLYCGSHILPFEKHFQAVPISTLWETNSGASQPFET